MSFYILDIEQLNNTSLALFCKETNEPYSLRKLTLKNVKPTFLVPSNDKDAFEMENYFYPDIPNICKFVRTTAQPTNSFYITEFTSPIEQFIISKKIRGPGIINIRNYQESTAGEIIVESMEEIIGFSEEKLPPLKILTLIVNGTNEVESFYSLTKNNILNTESYFSCGLKHLKKIFNKRCFNSNEVLFQLNDLIEKENPDLILVYNLNPWIHKKLNLFGRLVCDLFAVASSFVKCRNYSIEELCETLLHKSAINLHEERLLLIIYECFFAMNILELSLELTQICGNLLKRTLLNLRAERNEYFLMHEFYENKILFPPKQKREEESYKGGLVLDPKIGFYETKILLLDFNSLYPSIIQEYNICFSNKNGQKEELGILPRILKSLVDRRKEVKRSLAKSYDAKLNTKQLALKLTANSIYGCLGTPHFRFGDFELAKEITLKGRTILQDTKVLAEDLGLNVIYGDTDSIMIDTQTVKVGNEGEILKDLINKKYKFIEIEVEKVFKRLILLSKKKYGAITTHNQIETKGLDSVRRDFALISSEITNGILEIILKDSTEVVHNGNEKILQTIYSFLQKKKDNLTNEPHEKFIINACLAKPLEKYANPDILPHVSLAFRLKKRNIIYKKDDVISYVIGRGEKGESISKRACLPNECIIDYDYYISNQILPPINRILAHLKGVDFDFIGNIFGIKKMFVNKNIFTFPTLCCNEVQSIADKCKKCNQPVNKVWLNNLIRTSLRESTKELYKYEFFCPCGFKTKTPLKRCFICDSIMLFHCLNDKFDSLIESFGENEVVENYLQISEYRKIDLSIFQEEISYYKRNK
ncbi:hypothetical protein H312_00941, partial [Anncaliia algerae PRA339]